MKVPHICIDWKECHNKGKNSASCMTSLSQEIIKSNCFMNYEEAVEFEFTRQLKIPIGTIERICREIRFRKDVK